MKELISWSLESILFYKEHNSIGSSYISHQVIILIGMEDNMENAVMATQMLANLGIFLGAIGLLWFVTVYRDKEK
jgi:hypothetical protein